MSHRSIQILVTTALWLGVVAIVAGCGAAVWSNLEPAVQAVIGQVLIDQAGIIGTFTVFLGIGLALVVNWFFQSYVVSTRKMAEATQIIATANPGHRIAPTGTPESRELAAAINTFADRYQALQADIEVQIRAANIHLEEERNRLAALMSELTQSVLVCNAEGQILLYNSRARQLLGQALGDSTSNGRTSFVGLGRSIFSLLDRNLIDHALAQLHYHLQMHDPNLVSRFATMTGGGQLIRVQMAPVLDAQRAITGYVLTLEDIRRRQEISSRRDELLQSLIESTRSSLANIRAAIETQIEYPTMPLARREELARIIHDEAGTLSQRLDRTIAESSEYLRAQWILEEMLGSDVLSAIQRGIEQKLEVAPQIAQNDAGTLWLLVDSYAIVRAMTYLASRLHDERGIVVLTLALAPAGRFASLDLHWHGAPLDAETRWQWENQPIPDDGGLGRQTLRGVAEQHGGEVWYQADNETGASLFRLLLPITTPETIWHMPDRIESRPEYYDFDLFHQPGQRPDLDQRRLTELTYTVFDTETTGLHPSDRDEIIAIGAVRIVNGRLLRQEVFDQLIDPERLVSEESLRIHKIAPQQLRGQPKINQVLPRFHAFAEDTVLVAHNAAFDMRFLQLKEAQAGVTFGHPVLDTLLLSAVVHPNLGDHRLESIAERLGIEIVGRHTALGDAAVTAEVFLKLIPLLAELGILTLKDAREAAQRTYYARLTY